MTLRRLVVVSVMGGAVLAAVYPAVTIRAFQPVKVAVDLSHADQRGALEGPWEIRPDRRFPGVMSARDQGQPVHVLVTLPSADTYEGRFKIKFHHTDQAVEIRVNNTPITTVRPSRVSEAEKFDAQVPRTAVTPGTNRVTFIARGTPGAEYELVRLQNYRATLVKRQAYLLPRDRSFPWVPPYRIVCTPAFFWLLIAALVAIVGVIRVGPFVVTAAAQWVVARTQRLVSAGTQGLAKGTQGLAKGTAEAAKGADGFVKGLQQAPAVGRWLWQGLVYGGRVTLGVVRVTASALWRWFLRHQYPQGYGLLFCYCAAIALASHWVFRWHRFAELMGYLAGATLVIAIVWESLVSLKEEE